MSSSLGMIPPSVTVGPLRNASSRHSLSGTVLRIEGTALATAQAPDADEDLAVLPKIPEDLHVLVVD